MAKKMSKRPRKKQCPNCTATMFQGPFTRGPIEDGELTVEIKIYQCLACHNLFELDQLADAPTLEELLGPDAVALVEEQHADES